jgi:hypothetical protein
MEESSSWVIALDVGVDVSLWNYMAGEQIIIC